MSQIKHVLFLGALVALAGVGERSAFAVDNSLQDLWFNADGSFTEYTGSAISGVDLSSYNTTTGLGTITFTDTTAGADYFDAWFDVPVGTPFYNQYGTAAGTAASGESWEIGDYYTGTIGDDAYNGTLDNTNNLPGTTDNYLDTCVGASCNGYATAALGDSYGPVIGDGDEEIITLTVSQTAPGSGFYIQQTNPDDNDNPLAPTAESEYFSLSAEYIPAGSSPPPTVTPEPSTWLLMLSGLSILAWRMRTRFALKTWGRFTALLAVAAVAMSASARAQSVLTVPWDPATPAAPHTAYPGANIVLGAVFTGNITGHSYTVSWNYGDGSAATTPTAISNFNDISSTHTYVGTTVGQTWTAVATVSDTTASLQYTGNYLVIWENNVLQSRVNAAIDWGLWYLHQAMYHPSTTTGSWASGCGSGSSGYACGTSYGSLDATNVQAFEVNGHLSSGPASDPYTSDVAEGLADMLTYLDHQAVTSKTYTYNPASANFGCSDGTAPTSTNHGSPSFYCDTSATPVFYEPSSTSCGTPPCTVTFDGNSNGYAVYASQEYGYENGMYADALVASGTPAAMGTVSWGTESYKDLVQDIVDMAGYCQYPSDYDVANGYTRGDNNNQGGGWWYSYECQGGGDNSTSQWTSIGLIAAQRGFGITIPQIIPDMNNMWVTASQNVQSPDVQGVNSGSGGNVNDPTYSGYYSSSYDYGGFGYNGSLYYSDAWGPWAVTPSGMVQMSLDGIGRTSNTAFNTYSSGEYSSTAADQRFNAAETYYADNFCDGLTGPYASAYFSPLTYTYGMFSFTKSMLLHNPNGTLQPIQYLRTLTPGVFTTNTSVPTNTIDWYAALSPAHGGTDPCDGVAQTLLDRQYASGYWYGSNASSAQYAYETAWALIMLQKSVFVACVNNLGGAGTPSGSAPARIDLTWTGIPTASGYEVLRSTASGGPYNEVGTTLTTAYSDRTGLTNGDTYYYVLEPLNASGVTECQSNQATITIPKPRTF